MYICVTPHKQAKVRVLLSKVHHCMVQYYAKGKKASMCWLIVMPISVFLKVKLMLVIIISELVYVHFLLVILYTVISVTA